MRIAAIAIGLSALALNACAPVSQDAGKLAPPPAGARYVAMGSSMASGPGLGQPKPGTPVRCTRSFYNYPTLLAERLKLTLYDVTCSGAATDHILESWNELPAQIDAVTADTELVTVTIGGNDLNYVGGLIAAGCGTDGTATIAGRTFKCPPRRVPTEGDFAKVGANLREIARQVRSRAPKARLLFVEYLRLVPETPCAATPLAEQDAAAARAIGERLHRITVQAAKDTGAALVPVHTESASHTACGEGPWAVGNPPGYDGSDGAPWHPNSKGMVEVTNSIERVLGSRQAPKAKPNAEPASEAEPKAAPALESTEEPEAQPVEETKAEPVTESVPVVQPVAEAEGQVEPLTETDANAVPEPESAFEAAFETVAEPDPEPAVEPEEPLTTDAETEVEPVAEPAEKTEIETEAIAEPTTGAET